MEPFGSLIKEPFGCLITEPFGSMIKQGSTHCVHGDERARNVHENRLSRAQYYEHVN